MKDLKFSKGKFYLEDEYKNKDGVLCKDISTTDFMTSIATVYVGEPYKEECEANAKLFIAAPELLKAAIKINNLLADNGFCGTFKSELEKAIKKATE
jgi:hypothetical protein